MQNQNPNNEDKNVVTLAEVVEEALGQCAETRKKITSLVEEKGEPESKKGLVQLWEFVDKINNVVREELQKYKDQPEEGLSEAYLFFLSLIVNSIHSVEDPELLKSLAIMVKLHIHICESIQSSGHPPVTH